MNDIYILEIKKSKDKINKKKKIKSQWHISFSPLPSTHQVPNEHVAGRINFLLFNWSPNSSHPS